MPLLTDVAEKNHEPAGRQRMPLAFDDAAIRKHALRHIRLLERAGLLAYSGIDAG